MKPLLSGFSLAALLVFLNPIAARVVAAQTPGSNSAQVWRDQISERLQKAGRPNEAARIRGKTPPAGWYQSAAGDLGLALAQTTDGVRLESLFDLGRGQELLATNTLPLFSLVLREATTKKELRLNADAGWQQVTVRKSPSSVELRWEAPREAMLGGISVSATATVDKNRCAWRWQFRVENHNPAWSVWHAVFPQLALADLGPETSALFPRGPGEVRKNAADRDFKYHGNYPGGWCAMQFMAVYREGNDPTGLYVAVHDPWGGTKDLALEGDPAARCVRLRFDHPAPDMGRAGNSFVFSGEVVWQLLRGDWFDAATIYKTWARKEARWWPRLGAEGREDTPAWMRELNAWTMTGGQPRECVTRVRDFQKALGLPTGFHWYNWHQIPFDNDYPHYFPATEGFAQGVAELQKSGVFVMPYINGRLWDALDRGAEDFEFTRLALPATTKKDDGQPFLESYGSKETNGQPVRLAAMCPTTRLWQQTVSNIVLRLVGENGTKSVYIDQIAAAAPTLCMDPSHGHPLGGGHWWNEGYWNMLDAIRRAKPADSMLTTECNGEPFVRWLDGYLTWHWQFDGQVPAFPAIYGGAIQMFGRAYRGGATKDLALRMKAGQELVYGEQIGWLDPDVVKEKENMEFFRQVVGLRSKFSRYFHAGEMARPPRLIGSIPTVKADWQWSGEWWVTTDAVLSGAWKPPGEKRLAMVFVNVSDAPVEATVRIDASQYGIRARRLHCTVTRSDGMRGEPAQVGSVSERQVVFAPRQAEVWEARW